MKQSWIPRREVVAQFNIPSRRLDAALTEGFIRTLKFGEKPQAARLYYRPDVEAWLLALSAGRVPRRTRGLLR